MAKAADVSPEDVAAMLKIQREHERAAARLEDTKAAYKAAEEEVAEKLSQYLHALCHGLPLFEQEPGGE